MTNVAQRIEELLGPAPDGPIAEALARWDREKMKQMIADAEAERQSVASMYPLEEWPTLPLERYAVGQEGSPKTFCTLLEFRANLIGSIKGGSSRKLLIYKHASKPGWYFDTDRYRNEVEAWSDIRAGFVSTFNLAAEERFAEIDEIPALRGAGALKAKACFVYYPDKLMPIYAADAIRHFSDLLGGADPTLSRLAANRALFDLAFNRSEFTGWTPLEVGRFLYWWKDPRGFEKVIKIAPGANAKYWDDCLKGGYICVGWDEVGDLSAFPSKDEFRQAFAQEYLDTYNGHQGAVTRKANELWTLRDLEDGDVIIANKGTSRVVGIGKVTGPYHWDDSRTEYRHTVPVEWDASATRVIEPVKPWATRTVATVNEALYRRIISGDGASKGPDVREMPKGLMSEVADALLRKGQVILHGPPGTGKTYNARLFSQDWLKDQGGNGDEEALARKPGGNSKGVPYLTRVTFHPSYAYEEFVEGYRPRPTNGGGLDLELRDGIFKQICTAAAEDPEHRYLLVIDEINRGNVPRILGELITLLEMDKRGMAVRLPQSGETLAVPLNLYILGTMNTADRSIRLLDAALRRRFAFIELMPDADLLAGAYVGELPLETFLSSLNDRIAEKLGREKQVGHSFFLEDGAPVTDPVEFFRRMRHEVIPLLQEYAFDDFRDLEYYLGSSLVDVGRASLVQEALDDPEAFVAALWDGYRVASEEE